jgi:PKD repeat protein
VFGSTGGTWTLNDLIPGSYTLTETDPGQNWIVTPGLTQPVTVDYGTQCATATITNTFNFGCLEVTKEVMDLPVGWTEEFEICITGPSYPSGDCKTISETGGVLTWNNLIPGIYTVSETDPGVVWEVTGGGTVTVNPGTPCATATITNTWDPPCILEVWVDDNFHPGTSGWYYDHFPNIQDAVEVVDVGGIVHVYPGTYRGEIVIDDYPCDNTGITIEGIDGCPPLPMHQSAIIAGNFRIKVDGVTIRNFVFESNTQGSIIVEGNTDITIICNIFKMNCEPNSVGVHAWQGSIVDAEYNWWGAPDGPNGGIMDDGAIADGMGVKVIGPVWVEPWVGVHAEATASAYSVEIGDTIVFNAAGSFAADFGGTYEPEYYWTFEPLYHSSSKQPTYVFNSPGTYIVSLRAMGHGITHLHSNFMFDWAYLTIEVNNPTSTLSANAGGDGFGIYKTLIDEPLTLQGGASGGTPPYSYNWDLGDGSSSSQQNPTNTYTTKDVYTVLLTVTDDTGHTAVDTAIVEVYEIEELIVDIGVQDNIDVETPVKFNSYLSGGWGPYTFAWDFGDGSTSSEANPTHSYNSKGTYTVSLSVIDSRGNDDIATKEITVEGVEEVTEIIKVNGGFGIKATIKAGDNSIDWSIKIDGIVLIGGNADGVIPSGTTDTVNIPFSFGFGAVDITITAGSQQKTYSALALGPFFLNIQEK